LTFDFDFQLDDLVHGGNGWGSPTPRRKKVIVKQRYYLVMGPIGAPAPRRTGRQTVGRNITWTWTRVIALQITDPSPHQRRCPTSTNQQLSKKIIFDKLVAGPRWEPDTRMDWPSDWRS
jgi:hypothetical protein